MSNTITMYSAEWCGYCTVLQEKLDTRGIAYEYRNVDEAGVREEMNALTDGNQTIPVLIKGESYWVNPNDSQLKEYIYG